MNEFSIKNNPRSEKIIALNTIFRFSSPYIPVTNFLMRIITIIAMVMEQMEDPMTTEQTVNRHNP